MKRQHQIVQQINELQAKRLDIERTLLDKKLETIGLEKGRNMLNIMWI